MLTLILAAAAAVTLTWTVPQYREAVAGRSAFVTYVPKECRVYRHVQSSAWRAMHPAMQLDGDVWAATWPTVKWEARPVLVATLPLSPLDAGRRMTWTAPTADTVTAFYFVTTVDTAGREARQSNERGR